MFGALDENASVINLGLENVSVEGTGEKIGGLVGLIKYGANVYNCYSSGKISGDWGIGGLVGLNDGNISTCCSSATIQGNISVGGLVGSNEGTLTTSYSTGKVRGRRSYIGGLVGRNTWQISHCYSTGMVDGGAFVGGLVGVNSYLVSYSYSTGVVEGGNYVGGLVGENYPDHKAPNSFWNIDTSGWIDSAGGTGLTTAEMLNVNTFLDAGWDFVDETANGTEDIWWMPDNDYPMLGWQAP